MVTTADSVAPEPLFWWIPASSPYIIRAIGNPQLEDNADPARRFLGQDSPLNRLSIEEKEELYIPPYKGGLVFNYAEVCDRCWGGGRGTMIVPLIRWRWYGIALILDYQIPWLCEIYGRAILAALDAIFGGSGPSWSEVSLSSLSVVSSQIPPWRRSWPIWVTPWELIFIWARW